MVSEHTAEKDGLHSIWREAAEKRIEHGIDWPRIVLSLLGDLAEAEARVTRWEAAIHDYENRALAAEHALRTRVFPSEVGERG